MDIQILFKTISIRYIKMNTITITSILPYYIEVLEYIYSLGKDRIKDFDI